MDEIPSLYTAIRKSTWGGLFPAVKGPQTSFAALRARYADKSASRKSGVKAVGAQSKVNVVDIDRYDSPHINPSEFSRLEDQSPGHESLSTRERGGKKSNRRSPELSVSHGHLDKDGPKEVDDADFENTGSFGDEEKEVQPEPVRRGRKSAFNTALSTLAARRRQAKDRNTPPDE